VLGYFHFTTRFTAKFTNVEEGIDGQVWASLGTALLSQYRVKELPEGGRLELSINDTITVGLAHGGRPRWWSFLPKGIFLFMPLIVNRVATRQSHQLDKLVAILENRLNGESVLHPTHFFPWRHDTYAVIQQWTPLNEARRLDLLTSQS
jgi:hypothetical protein